MFDVEGSVAAGLRQKMKVVLSIKYYTHDSPSPSLETLACPALYCLSSKLTACSALLMYLVVVLGSRGYMIFRRPLGRSKARYPTPERVSS